MKSKATIPKTWEILFAHALKLVDEIAAFGRAEPFWTFGGGTVLMLKYGHRYSKKLWHRGDQLTGRDVFDFALVACKERDALRANSAVMIRHYDAILEQLEGRSESLRKQFDALVTLDFHPTFNAASATLRKVLADMNEMHRS